MIVLLPAMSQYRIDHHQQQTFLTGRFPRGDKLWKKRFSQDFLAERIHVGHQANVIYLCLGCLSHTKCLC